MSRRCRASAIKSLPTEIPTGKYRQTKTQDKGKWGTRGWGGKLQTLTITALAQLFITPPRNDKTILPLKLSAVASGLLPNMGLSWLSSLSACSH